MYRGTIRAADKAAWRIAEEIAMATRVLTEAKDRGF